ncbi:hypothetical protein EMCRGX_G002132 [Ephydatia muelleri]
MLCASRHSFTTQYLQINKLMEQFLSEADANEIHTYERELGYVLDNDSHRRTSEEKNGRSRVDGLCHLFAERPSCRVQSSAESQGPGGHVGEGDASLATKSDLHGKSQNCRDTLWSGHSTKASVQELLSEVY